LVSKLSHAVKNDRKRIRRTIRELLDERYLLAHKGGDTIPLNPTKNREIIEYIRKVTSL